MAGGGVCGIHMAGGGYSYGTPNQGNQGGMAGLFGMESTGQFEQNAGIQGYQATPTPTNGYTASQATGPSYSGLQGTYGNEESLAQQLQQMGSSNSAAQAQLTQASNQAQQQLAGQAAATGPNNLAARQALINGSANVLSQAGANSAQLQAQQQAAALQGMGSVYGQMGGQQIGQAGQQQGLSLANSQMQNEALSQANQQQAQEWQTQNQLQANSQNQLNTIGAMQQGAIQGANNPFSQQAMGLYAGIGSTAGSIAKDIVAAAAGGALIQGPRRGAHMAGGGAVDGSPPPAAGGAADPSGGSNPLGGITDALNNAAKSSGGTLQDTLSSKFAAQLMGHAAGGALVSGPRHDCPRCIVTKMAGGGACGFHAAGGAVVQISPGRSTIYPTFHPDESEATKQWSPTTVQDPKSKQVVATIDTQGNAAAGGALAEGPSKVLPRDQGPHSPQVIPGKPGGQQVTIGEKGPEAVVPLDGSQGDPHEFLDRMIALAGKQANVDQVVGKNPNGTVKVKLKNGGVVDVHPSGLAMAGGGYAMGIEPNATGTPYTVVGPTSNQPAMATAPGAISLSPQTWSMLPADAPQDMPAGMSLDDITAPPPGGYSAKLVPDIQSPAAPAAPAAKVSLGAGMAPALALDKGTQGKLDTIEGEQEAGAKASSAATSAMGEREADLYSDAATAAARHEHELADTQAARDSFASDAQAKMQAVNDSIMQGVHRQSMGDYFASKSTGGKVLTGIGLAMGGIGSALQSFGTGKVQENPALTYINNAIQQDVDQQKTNLELKDKGLEGMKSIYGLHMQQLGDRDAASSAAMSTHYGMVEQQIKQAMASNISDQAKAGLQNLLAGVQAERLKAGQEATQFATNQRMERANLQGKITGNQEQNLNLQQQVRMQQLMANNPGAVGNPANVVIDPENGQKVNAGVGVNGEAATKDLAAAQQEYATAKKAREFNEKQGSLLHNIPFIGGMGQAAGQGEDIQLQNAMALAGGKVRGANTLMKQGVVPNPASGTSSDAARLREGERAALSKYMMARQKAGLK